MEVEGWNTSEKWNLIDFFNYLYANSIDITPTHYQLEVGWRIEDEGCRMEVARWSVDGGGYYDLVYSTAGLFCIYCIIIFFKISYCSFIW